MMMSWTECLPMQCSGNVRFKLITASLNRWLIPLTERNKCYLLVLEFYCSIFRQQCCLYNFFCLLKASMYSCSTLFPSFSSTRFNENL